MKAKRRLRERGQDLAEYALVVPIFLLFLAVITDMGRITYYYAAVYNSAREGARYGIIRPTDVAGIEGAARSKAVGLDPAATTVASLIDAPSNTIRVTMTYQFTPLTPIVETLLGGSPLTLSSQSIMQIEQ